ncbi:MAG: sugar ABC transporter permease [Rubellimicrobium sp.]|nr:sugar ABC transporter permease [Rubellimicrobium sp.]
MPRGLSLEQATRRLAVLLVLPTWVLLILVFALPLAGAIWLSFRNETLGSFVTPRFIGWENYRGAFADPRFWESIRTTLFFMVAGLAIQLPLGIGLALLLHRNLRGTAFFRSALIVPMLLTPVAVGLMWRFMLDADFGIINWALRHVIDSPPNWLGARIPARFAVVMVDSWISIPFVMLMVLAGLSSLPRGPAEAAAIDGAGPLAIFVFITLPSLVPVILVIVMIRVVDVVKLFDILFIVTQRGGPGTATQTLGLLTYNTGFIFFQTSRAAALGVLLTLMVIPIYFIWRRVGRAP